MTKAFNIKFSDLNNNQDWAHGRSVGIKTIKRA
jgi:hypothetical protein